MGSARAAVLSLPTAPWLGLLGSRASDCGRVLQPPAAACSTGSARGQALTDCSMAWLGQGPSAPSSRACSSPMQLLCLACRRATDQASVSAAGPRPQHFCNIAASTAHLHSPSEQPAARRIASAATAHAQWWPLLKCALLPVCLMPPLMHSLGPCMRPALCVPCATCPAPPPPPLTAHALHAAV